MIKQSILALALMTGAANAGTVYNYTVGGANRVAFDTDDNGIIDYHGEVRVIGGVHAPNRHGGGHSYATGSYTSLNDVRVAAYGNSLTGGVEHPREMTVAAAQSALDTFNLLSSTVQTTVETAINAALGYDWSDALEARVAPAPDPEPEVTTPVFTGIDSYGYVSVTGGVCASTKADGPFNVDLDNSGTANFIGYFVPEAISEELFPTLGAACIALGGEYYNTREGDFNNDGTPRVVEEEDNDADTDSGSETGDSGDSTDGDDSSTGDAPVVEETTPECDEACEAKKKADAEAAKKAKEEAARKAEEARRAAEEAARIAKARAEYRAAVAKAKGDVEAQIGAQRLYAVNPEGYTFIIGLTGDELSSIGLSKDFEYKSFIITPIGEVFGLNKAWKAYGLSVEVSREVAEGFSVGINSGTAYVLDGTVNGIDVNIDGTTDATGFIQYNFGLTKDADGFIRIDSDGNVSGGVTVRF